MASIIGAIFGTATAAGTVTTLGTGELAGATLAAAAPELVAPAVVGKAATALTAEAPIFASAVLPAIVPLAEPTLALAAATPELVAPAFAGKAATAIAPEVPISASKAGFSLKALAGKAGKALVGGGKELAKASVLQSLTPGQATPAQIVGGEAAPFQQDSELFSRDETGQMQMKTFEDFLREEFERG